MCRNIRSACHHHQDITGLTPDFVSHTKNLNLDELSDEFESLELDKDLKRDSHHSSSDRLLSSNEGYNLWQFGSSEGESELFIRSESGSESCSDRDFDGDTTQKLKNEISKIDGAIYEDEPFDGLGKSVLEECHLLTEHFPHIRVTGHGYKLEKAEPESPEAINAEGLLEEEEVFAYHYDKNDTNEIFTFSEDGVNIAEPDGTLEKYVDFLFRDIRPEILRRLQPRSKVQMSFESLFLTDEPEKLGSQSARASKSFLSVSPLLARSKSSHEVDYKYPSFIVEGETCTLSRNTSSSNPSARCVSRDKTSTIVVLPPAFKAAPLNTRSQRKPGHVHAVSAKVNKTETSHPYQNASDYRFNNDAKPVIPPHNKTRHGLLPPIDHISELQLKNGRSRPISAMIRYRTTSSQPSLASRNRAMLTPIEMKNPTYLIKHKGDPLKEGPEQALVFMDSTTAEVRQVRKTRPKPLPWR